MSVRLTRVRRARGQISSCKWKKTKMDDDNNAVRGHHHHHRFKAELNSCFIILAVFFSFQLTASGPGSAIGASVLRRAAAGCRSDGAKSSSRPKTEAGGAPGGQRRPGCATASLARVSRHDKSNLIRKQKPIFNKPRCSRNQVEFCHGQRFLTEMFFRALFCQSKCSLLRVVRLKPNNTTRCSTPQHTTRIFEVAVEK